MFVKCKQKLEVAGKDKFVETLSIHMIKNLKTVYKRNFELDSGISIQYLDYQPF